MKVSRTGLRIGVTVLAVGASLLAIPTSLEAQRAAGISRVGWLEVCGPGPRRPHFDIFRGRLAELGYVEGKNLIIEQRFADCRYDRMPGLATELVKVSVDVLFTMGTRASRIVAETVKTTPIVVYSCDPFEHVTRLARGRGNLTGVTCMTTELSPKRLELLHEAVPKASRVMFLQSSSCPQRVEADPGGRTASWYQIAAGSSGGRRRAATGTHDDREGAS